MGAMTLVMESIFFGCQKFRHNQIMSLRSKSPETSKFTIIAFGDSITEETYSGATIKETFPVAREKQILLVDHFKISQITQ